MAYHEESFWAGVVLGLQLKGWANGREKRAANMCIYGTPSETGNIGLRSGESVTLYRGAALPKLPEWDKEAYPYAAVRRGLANYSLDLWSVQPVVDEDPDTVVRGYGPNGEATTLMYCEYFPTNMEGWGEFKTMTYSNPTRSLPMWTNTDIYTTEGELYLAKSDPIPVSGIVDYVGDIPVYEKRSDFT